LRVIHSYSKIKELPKTTILTLLIHGLWNQAEELMLLKKLPPLDAFGLVGLAWTLASKSDQNGNASFAHDYLKDLIKTYKDDVNAVKFFNALMPVFFGVVSKLSAARDRALSSFEKVDDLKKTQLEKLDRISGLGTSVQGVITRSLGVIAGGAVGFLRSTDSGGTISVPSSVLLGIVAGYVIMEISLQIYKAIETKRIKYNTWTDKEKAWDREFTMEAHRATLLLYRETGSIINEVYGQRKQKIREISRDFQKMIEMFMQRPTSEESSASRLGVFLHTSGEIEFIMAEFINSNRKLKDDFQEYEAKEEDTDKRADPFTCGLKGLSIYLRKRNLIEENLLRDILKVRKRRIRLVYHTDYSGFDDKPLRKNSSTESPMEEDPISYAKRVHDSLKDVLDKQNREEVNKLLASRQRASTRMMSIEKSG
jgi:hypothetical protein